MNELILKARYLRKNMTKQEHKLWSVIKNGQFYGYKFLRQYVIGKYIVDFVCREKKIIIEIDGGQHNQKKNNFYDKKRSEFLCSIGYKVIRFWNSDIENNIEGVYIKLQELFGIKSAPTPTLPRKGGGEESAPTPTLPRKGGSEELAPTPTLPRKGGSKESEPTPTLPRKGGSEELAPTPTLPHKGGSEESAPAPTLPRKGGSEELAPTPTLPHKGGSKELAPTPTLPQKGGGINLNIQDKNLYYIGGVVRDEILGFESFDIDLTYDGDAIEFAKTIPNTEILQINKPFGTVRIKLDNQEIDIASTRSESYPKKGHLPVIDKIGCSFKEDVMRRDFTINAMAKSTLTGEIIDYTGGLIDIKNKKLRIIHDNSFIDDPTRILRALKFAVRFGFEIEEHTAQLQKTYLENINYDMSYKRLKKELIETFNLNNWNAFERFVNQGIYKLIAPQNFKFPDYNFSELITRYKPKNIWIIYVGLLPDISNLPLTKIEKNIVDGYKNLANLCFAQNDDIADFELYKTFKNIPQESVIMYSTVNSKPVEHYLNDLKDIELEISGQDLKNLGIKPSEKYQECFDFVLKEKIKNPDLTKNSEITLAKEFFAN